MDLSTSRFGGASLDLAYSSASGIARRRRRVAVFLGVFTLIAVIGLGYTYSRPAEYRAGARIQIVIPPQSEVVGPNGTRGEANFLAEVERVSSRPVLEEAATRTAGPDARTDAPNRMRIDEIVRMVTVQPVEGTDVVQLTAIGPHAEDLPNVLNATIEAYRDDLHKRSVTDTSQSVALAEDEVRRIEETVQAKREAMKRYATRYQIVSLERDENELLSQLRGNASALNNAEEKLALAEGKLKSLQEQSAKGTVPVRAKDSPTLANLEQRASQIREELRNLERVYKEDYLGMNPDVRAKRAALSELDSQIRTERQSSSSLALTEAEQEVASYRATVDRLRQRINAGRGEVQLFAARMADYKSMSEEVAGLEKLHRTAVERAVKLRTGDNVRAPSVRVVEAAVEPSDPWRPPYTRDAGISLGIALLAALIVLLIYDYLTPREKVSTLLMAGAPMVLPSGSVGALPGMGTVPQALGQAPVSGLLENAAPLPRELSGDEIGRLLAAADPDARLAALLLLSGLSVDEATAVRWSDVDWDSNTLHVKGASARDLALSAPLRDSLAERREHRAIADDDAPIPAGSWSGAGETTLDAALACAAHDAMIGDASTVNAQALRHSYLAFLVRQGLRFADLRRIVGDLPGPLLTSYMALAPSGARIGIDEVKLAIPGIAAVSET